MCLTPLTIKSKRTQEQHSVPCGKCPKCLSRRISGWSFRLLKQFDVSDNAHFVTLTYDTTTVPISEHGFMSLSKRDVQLFFKRLRKAHPKGSAIKYYTCGEYGGKTNRPHYHSVMFNVERSLIQEAWAKGSVHYGTVNGASIGYCLKYMSKPGRFPKFKGDDRISEFSLMSKNWVRPTLLKP